MRDKRGPFLVNLSQGESPLAGVLSLKIGAAYLLVRLRESPADQRKRRGWTKSLSRWIVRAVCEYDIECEKKGDGGG